MRKEADLRVAHGFLRGSGSDGGRSRAVQSDVCTVVGFEWGWSWLQAIVVSALPVHCVVKTDFHVGFYLKGWNTCLYKI